MAGTQQSSAATAPAPTSPYGTGVETVPAANGASRPVSDIFPELTKLSPPTFLNRIGWFILWVVTGVLSSIYFQIIFNIGELFNLLDTLKRLAIRAVGRDPDAKRPFHEEEKRRAAARHSEKKTWKRQRKGVAAPAGTEEEMIESREFVPLEGGRDKLRAEIGYYARRVGLDAELYKVQTDDGFILPLYHLYNPKTTTARPESARTTVPGPPGQARGKPPVLMLSGLLAHPGTYCVNDDDSLAFYLAKGGYDVWLGVNRCGFKPEHATLKRHDPRIWAWTPQYMGVFDLPAHLDRVLHETGHSKLALVGHSQGTTQTLIALSKRQRPDIGPKISVFCALAPAAYPGPALEMAHFKFMRVIPHWLYTLIFGIHVFIPIMSFSKRIAPPGLFGKLGYVVLSFVFAWRNLNWERDLRSRMFQFAPIYASAEHLRWWTARGGFADRGCILHDGPEPWYDERAPPMALWIAGDDNLVNSFKLRDRLQQREPNVNLVYARAIDGYEHMDVIWAVDLVDKVGYDMRRIIGESFTEAPTQAAAEEKAASSLAAPAEPPVAEKVVTAPEGSEQQEKQESKLETTAKAAETEKSAPQSTSVPVSEPISEKIHEAPGTGEGAAVSVQA